MNRTLQLLIQCLLLASVLSGTSAFAVRVQRGPSSSSQVPAWPKDGKIPPQFVTRYVFYDNDTDEFVIAFPENLGTPEYARSHGALKIFRVQSNRTARAIITFGVTLVDGKYRYAYRVENRAEARRPVTLWDLVLPQQLEDKIVAPLLWRGAPTDTDIPAVGEALGTPGSKGVVVSWYFDDEHAPIAPGKALDGFVLTTTKKPGITLAYVTGGYIENTPDLPDAVESQREIAMSYSGNRQTVPMVGPLFPASTSRAVIAANLFAGINRMVASGQLQAQSPAVREALERLKDYSANVGLQTPMTLNEQGRGAFEKALLNAVVLAMK
jgi:hypothetical protein